MTADARREQRDAAQQGMLARGNCTRSVAISDSFDESQVEDGYLGTLDLLCDNCHSKNLAHEKPRDGKFTVCSQRGKVSLPKMKEFPEYPKNLMIGNDANSDNFRDNILCILLHL